MTQNKEFEVFHEIRDLEHEQVMFCNDPDTGLRCIIAIHNTTLGPALGGTRMWQYKTDNAAIVDVLRLSRGMTYKAAISGINLGGGKAVIIGDSRTQKSELLWRRYGQFVDSLNGKYITAEDVGTSTRDMEFVAMETKYVTGKPDYLGGGGDPSPVTAYGTYLGMKASAKERWGTDNLNDKTVAVQGVGHVGMHLVELLVKDGAKVVISDINEGNLKAISARHSVKVVGIDEIYDVTTDIFAPCALGATINDETIPRLKCSIIAGAANNQLQDEVKHGMVLMEKGILFAPDFLINAGGLINCYAEVHGYNKKRALGTAEKIYDRTLEIYAKAKKESLTSQEAAIQVAKERIQGVARLNKRR